MALLENIPATNALNFSDYKLSTKVPNGIRCKSWEVDISSYTSEMRSGVFEIS
jgi:hypothetical protein